MRQQIKFLRFLEILEAKEQEGITFSSIESRGRLLAPMDEEGRLLTGAPGYTLVHRGDLLQISISGMRASYLHALGAPLGWPRQVHPR